MCLDFLNSLTNKLMKVNGMVKLKPNSSGTIAPKTIPKIVESCQVTHKPKPEPNKW